MVNEFSPCKGGGFRWGGHYTIKGKSYMIHTLHSLGAYQAKSFRSTSMACRRRTLTVLTDTPAALEASSWVNPLK